MRTHARWLGVWVVLGGLQGCQWMVRAEPVVAEAGGIPFATCRQAPVLDTDLNVRPADRVYFLPGPGGTECYRGGRP